MSYYFYDRLEFPFRCCTYGRKDDMIDKFNITHAFLCRCYGDQCFQDMAMDIAAFDNTHNGVRMLQSQVFIRSKISKYIKLRYVLEASISDKMFLSLIFGLFMLLF